jgi:very-short-patch-repair endonuclease
MHGAKPTKLEQKFDAFFKQNNFPFNYVGDGKLWIDGKNPDFVCNPKKLVIEVGNKTEKSIKRKGRIYCDWKGYEEQRKAHFKKSYFDCLCLWEDELKNPQLMVQKIKQITFRPS